MNYQQGQSMPGQDQQMTTLQQQQQAQAAQAAALQQAQAQQAATQQLLQQFWARQFKEIENTKDFKSHELPLARIKKIMKSDEDVRMISAEAPILFAKACEMFILELTLRSWIHTEESKRKTLQRNDIATAISKTDIFDFLIDIVPREDGKNAKKEEMPGRPAVTMPPEFAQQHLLFYQLAQQQAQAHQAANGQPAPGAEGEATADQQAAQAQGGQSMRQPMYDPVFMSNFYQTMPMNVLQQQAIMQQYQMVQQQAASAQHQDGGEEGEEDGHGQYHQDGGAAHGANEHDDQQQAQQVAAQQQAAAQQAQQMQQYQQALQLQQAALLQQAQQQQQQHQQQHSDKDDGLDQQQAEQIQ